MPRILYVENHAVFAAQVTDAFLADCAVTIVPTVAQARALLSGTPVPFDAVLCDYDLDDGKGDLLVCDFGAAIPCIAVSGHAEGNLALQGAGCVAVCGKLDFARIRSVIAEVLQRGSNNTVG